MTLLPFGLFRLCSLRASFLDSEGCEKTTEILAWNTHRVSACADAGGGASRELEFARLSRVGF